MQQIIVDRDIKAKIPRAYACNTPLFRSYLERKAKYVGLKSLTSVLNTDYYNILKKNDLRPGHNVKSD